MNDTIIVYQPCNAIIPTEMDEAGHNRRRHLDLPELTSEQAWAEQHLLSTWYAERVFRKERPRYLADDLTDQGWARERLQRLRHLTSTRRAA